MFREPHFRLPGFTIYSILVCLIALLWPAQAAAQAVIGQPFAHARSAAPI